MKKKLIALALASGAALLSVPASATVVAGIDFGLNGSTHIETMTLAQQFINPSTTTAGTGSGMGYGYITSVNGDTTYAAGNAGLYYTVSFFGGTFTSPSQVEFTGTTVNLYYLPSFTNLLNFSSGSNLATIQGGTLYASLDGHGNLGGGLAANVVSASYGTLSGSILNFFGNGLLDVNMGAAGNVDFMNYLNGDSELDAIGGLADISYTESANNSVLNTHDSTTGCKTGVAATGQWCLAGTLNTRGTTEIPEPGSLALLALGLLGAGMVRRRRS